MKQPERFGGRTGRGRVRADPVPVSESLSELSAHLGTGSSDVLAVVFGHWETTVGPSVAAHVRPLRLNGDTLFLGVDHPAWVTQVRHLTPQILERLSEACGEGEAPDRIEVRVMK
jgi:predicted nucleic acid-binding Zn ribbon protein